MKQVYVVNELEGCDSYFDDPKSKSYKYSKNVAVFDNLESAKRFSEELFSKNHRMCCVHTPAEWVVYGDSIWSYGSKDTTTNPHKDTWLYYDVEMFPLH